jgi:hypothetical protein
MNALDEKIQSLFNRASELMAMTDHQQIRGRALTIKRLAQEIATAARRLERETSKRS